MFRRLALAESHVVGRDHTVIARERLDQITKQIAPRRLPMNAQDDLAISGSFVDVMHAKTGNIAEARRERKRSVKCVIGWCHKGSPTNEAADNPAGRKRLDFDTTVKVKRIFRGLSCISGSWLAPPASVQECCGITNTKVC